MKPDNNRNPNVDTNNPFQKGRDTQNPQNPQRPQQTPPTQETKKNKGRNRNV